MAKNKEIEEMNKEIEEALAEKMAVECAIEAMAKDLCRLPCECSHCIYPKYRRSLEKCKAMEYAERAYAKGYRKQKVGRWLFEFTLDGDDFYVCSLCGEQEVLNGMCGERNIAKHLPYCHCGAYMKGESDA